MSIAEIGDTKSQQGNPQLAHVLVVVTHTHWDREWYLPFQNYRFKLVRLIDKLLNILDTSPDFKHFMLDGQTIVLDDYIEVRPEREADLKRHIESGRLLVGPWYILPDQFLISGEAHIQNMLRGLKSCRKYGSPMKVGYIPDSFGQISQMPQILRGFGIDTAVFWRGVGPEITQIEFLWEAPDGSIVNSAHLPGSANIGGYSTALAFNTGVESAVAQLEAVENFLIKRSTSGVTLLMNGNDHAEPTAELPETLKKVAEIMREKGKNYRFVHGTMPQFLEMVRQSGAWENPNVPRHRGEFRNPKLAHLLPGVTSARIWIKQWNHRVEGLLEREAGLALAWFKALPNAKSTYDPASLQGLYDTAWKYLLQNDPHDSICGCSVDQVHEEMKTRYAWAEQISIELRDEGFRSIANLVNTAAVSSEEKIQPIVVFNPTPLKRTDTTALTVSVNPDFDDFVITDADGAIYPHLITRREREVLFSMDIPAFALMGMKSQADDDGRVMGYSMVDIKFDRQLSNKEIVTVEVTAVYNSAAPTNPALMRHALSEAQKYIDDGVQTFKMIAYRQSSLALQFLSRDVPPIGYKTFALRARHENEPVFKQEVKNAPETIENEFYTIDVEAKTGLLTIVDKETGAVYSQINRFRDVADAGDEYNFSPISQDKGIESYFDAPQIFVRLSELEQSIEVNTALELPYSLKADRQSRSEEMTLCSLTTVVTLTPGSRRIDFETAFHNKVEDHRLQVLFPAPFAATESKAEGIFDVITRPVGVPRFDSKWLEDPMPQAPQKTFVSINDAESKLGLTVINRGLPEYEIVKLPDGNSAIAITLLRSVGWLSRDDLKTRRGHAGPGMPTPGAQCQGRHYFHYALMPHKGEWLVSGAQQQAHAFNHPMIGVMAAKQTGELPISQSFVEIQPRVMALSTIKGSDDGAAVIVRLWNPSDRDIPICKVRFFRQFSSVSLVNLEENETVKVLQQEADGSYNFSALAHKIITLRLDF
ncbi:glycoside hydrolase family 38 C-terminal domain-containing protein [Candidatus Chlorohelix sp.]|uniref:alpha-mannosidase n=1 Tax=Candidatus Chlorohelix sp. TaxID=3139201 RepID=UPI00302862E4